MKKPRLQGYYICVIPCSTEFTHPIPLKKQKCPKCGNLAERISYLNDMDVEHYKQRLVSDAIGSYYDGFC